VIAAGVLVRRHGDALRRNNLAYVRSLCETGLLNSIDITAVRVRRCGIQQRILQMSFLSRGFRKKSEALPPWAVLDQEALRIGAAMEHLQNYGNLDSFPGSPNEKLALMMTASRQGLVTWKRAAGRYELTSLGRRSIVRRTLRESEDPTNLPPASASAGKRWALSSGTIIVGIAGVAIGATAMALLPGSSSKQPREQAAVATASDAPGALNRARPSDAGNAPAATEAQTQALAPRQEQASASPAAAPPSPKAEPPKVEAQQQAAAHPGDADAVEGALAQQLALAPTETAPASATAGNGIEQTKQTATTEAKLPEAPAPALTTPAQNAASQPAPATSRKPAAEPKQQPPRRSDERARTHEAPRTHPEQSGYAKSKREVSGRSASKSSSRHHAATDERKSGTESKHTRKSLRTYAEDQDGEPGIIIRRYPDENDGPPPFVVMRHHHGDHDQRRGWEEDRPGYAYREPSPFGYRGSPSRFGLFDWMSR
jgi:hypothetical protein